MSKMSLGRSRASLRPQSINAGAVTDRLTSGLPPVAGGALLGRNNFIDECMFGKVERDRVPHSPSGHPPTPPRTSARGLSTSSSAVRRFVDKWSYFYMDL